MQKAQQLRSSVVNILIAEANHMNCQLVENAFRPRRNRLAVVGAVVSSGRALALLKESEPDVAIISAQLEEGPLEGYEVLRELRSLGCRTRAIMLLDSRERPVVIDAFRAGARGVIFRDEPLKMLSKCIHAVHRGQVWVNSEHLGYLLEALGQTAPSRLQQTRLKEHLSKREEDVVCLVAEGLSNKEVSEHLGLSEHTTATIFSVCLTSSACPLASSLSSIAFRKGMPAPRATITGSNRRWLTWRLARA
jgi:DNA-binding NarL/FixJ family response regulator